MRIWIWKRNWNIIALRGVMVYLYSSTQFIHTITGNDKEIKKKYLISVFKPLYYSVHHCITHGIINYKDPKSKMPSSKKLTCKGTIYAAFVYLSAAPSSPLLVLVWGGGGWFSNFVGSESGQIPDTEYGLQHSTTTLPPPSHTLSVNTVLWHREWG